MTTRRAPISVSNSSVNTINITVHAKNQVLIVSHIPKGEIADHPAFESYKYEEVWPINNAKKDDYALIRYGVKRAMKDSVTLYLPSEIIPRNLRNAKGETVEDHSLSVDFSYGHFYISAEKIVFDKAQLVFTASGHVHTDINGKKGAFVRDVKFAVRDGRVEILQ